jgi:hypothetical protein
LLRLARDEEAAEEIVRLRMEEEARVRGAFAARWISPKTCYFDGMSLIFP